MERICTKRVGGASAAVVAVNVRLNYMDMVERRGGKSGNSWGSRWCVLLGMLVGEGLINSLFRVVGEVLEEGWRSSWHTASVGGRGGHGKVEGGFKPRRFDPGRKLV